MRDIPNMVVSSTLAVAIIAPAEMRRTAPELPVIPIASARGEPE